VDGEAGVGEVLGVAGEGEVGGVEVVGGTEIRLSQVCCIAVGYWYAGLREALLSLKHATSSECST
jgi:hypothetical protein